MRPPVPVYFPLDFALVRSNWVYRFWDVHGECLYVGKSCGTPIIQRLSQHLTSINPTHRKPWADEVSRVEVTAFDTEEEAVREEGLMIRRFRPNHNKAGKPSCDTIPGLEWLPSRMPRKCFSCHAKSAVHSSRLRTARAARGDTARLLNVSAPVPMRGSARPGGGAPFR